MSRDDCMDYRDALIMKRLSTVSHVLLVTGGKGGVGKSTIASTAALILSQSSNRTGLLDLDLHGPSACLLLGVDESPVEAEEGLIPPSIGGLKVMSVDLFAKGRPLPLTGRAREEVVKELLAFTSFGPLDYLVVDMPPGTGDELLTVSRLTMRVGSAIVVTTPSSLAISVARRVIEILDSMNYRIAGVLENMSMGEGDSLSRSLAAEKGVKFLGAIPFDAEIMTAGEMGPEKLLSTIFARSLRTTLREAGLKVV
ncbi:MAG: P-loop NTPase [Candidatus Caldarchaeum sp.]